MCLSRSALEKNAYEHPRLHKPKDVGFEITFSDFM